MTKLGKEGQNGHFLVCLSHKKTKNLNSAIFLLQKGDLIGQRQKTSYSEPFLGFSLEREKLLSEISRDPTVRSIRDKKGSCSTQRGLRVGTGFKEFRKTP